ncbi:hypothetical protein Rhal01_00743 [Rubritalea halochordaticola]|uniref:Uncharacterized protein n=2 Tax=Rubritalea halochordaticola TaxID=714537 RepID=A0ABP9UVU0_9BACT
MCKCFILMVGVFALTADSYGQEPPLTIVMNRNVVLEKRKAYSETIKALESYRNAQRKEYQEANSSVKREILAAVRMRLIQDLCDEIFPAWYGTTWSSAGKSEQPGQGSISHGYFVSTSLQHAGFKLDRDEMARQPTEKVIVAMTKGKRGVVSGRSMDAVMKYLQSQGDGIYLVGMDRHFGYVTVRGPDVRFVHSSSDRLLRMVVCEPALGENALSEARYRVFGKLLDDAMLVSWMKGEQYTIK